MEELTVKIHAAVNILDAYVVKRKMKVFVHDGENCTRALTLIIIFIAIKNYMSPGRAYDAVNNFFEGGVFPGYEGLLELCE